MNSGQDPGRGCKSVVRGETKACGDLYGVLLSPVCIVPYRGRLDRFQTGPYPGLGPWMSWVVAVVANLRLPRRAFDQAR